jgi:hypothetical protein
VEVADHKCQAIYESTDFVPSLLYEGITPTQLGHRNTYLGKVAGRVSQQVYHQWAISSAPRSRPALAIRTRVLSDGAEVQVQRKEGRGLQFEVYE